MIRLIALFFQLRSRRKVLLLCSTLLSFYSYFLFKIKPNWIRFGEIGKIYKEDSQVDWSVVGDILFCIKTVSKRLPIHLVCRHEAHVAKIFLRYYQIPYQIFIGFKIGEANQIQGHAWTEVQGRQITGFCDPKDYVIQAVYS